MNRSTKCLGFLKPYATKQSAIKQPWAALVSIVALLSALYFNYITLLGLFTSLSFAAMCFLFSFNKKSTVNSLLGFGIFIFCVTLLLHLVPGFNNLLVIDQQTIASNAPAYSQFVNFDKALVALGLLVFVINNPPRPSNNNYRRVIVVISVAYLLAIVVGITSGLIAVEVKISQYLVLWVLINLFITCYAEEAFFRGFVQTVIAKIIKEQQYKSAIVVVLSGLLFGLAHIPAGLVYTIIAIVLGSAYAFAYLKTDNILVPILGHFFFNLIHFIFFTYPYITQG